MKDKPIFKYKRPILIKDKKRKRYFIIFEKHYNVVNFLYVVDLQKKTMCTYIESDIKKYFKIIKRFKNFEKAADYINTIKTS